MKNIINPKIIIVANILFFFFKSDILNGQTEFDEIAEDLSKVFFERKITYGHVSSYNESNNATRKKFKNQDSLLLKKYTPYQNNSYVFLRFNKPMNNAMKLSH